MVVGSPNTGNHAHFLSRVRGVLDSGRLTNDGPLVQEFERRIADQLGVRNCVATANATVALQLVLRATSLTGEVIVPAFTFVATAHAARWLGLRPVFCDVDPSTGLIDPGKVEQLISPATSAIIGVHLWGQGCDTMRLAKIAESYNLSLLFDAAHAFGCSHRGRPIGNFGAAEVFSFHATKVVTSMEGGAVATNDDELADRIRAMRNFGMNSQRQIVDIGSNGKLTEIGAAMGLTSLDGYPQVLSRNAENYAEYQDGLSGVEHLSPVELDPEDKQNFGYIVSRVHASAKISRDLLLTVLAAENIIAQPYFSPSLHRILPYRSRTTSLPAAERLAAEVFALPTGPRVSVHDIRMITDLIRRVVEHGDYITRHISLTESSPQKG